MPTPPLTDNAALNVLVDDVSAIEQTLSQTYTDVLTTGYVDVAVFGLERSPNPHAVKTVVLNQGGAYIQVSEDGNPLIIIAPLDSRELPMPGKGRITVNIIVGSASDSQAAITTYVYIPA